MLKPGMVGKEICSTMLQQYNKKIYKINTNKYKNVDSKRLNVD